MKQKLKEKNEKLEGLRAKISKVFDQAGDDCDFSKVTEITGSDEEKSAKLREMSTDAEKLAKEAGKMHETIGIKERNELEIEEAKERNRPLMPTKTREENEEDEGKKKYISLGAAFCKAKGHLAENRGKEIDLQGVGSIKTLFGIDQATSGWEPNIMLPTRLIDSAQRPIQVLDIFPVIPTSENAYTFLEETTHDGDNVVEKTEGTEFGEAQLDVERQSEPIQKIPVHIPVTDEQLDDVPAATAYLNNRLPAMLMRRADGQSINGNGNSPNLRGILSKSGRLAVTPEATDGIADVILRAIKDVRVTGRALASAIILNPTDWLNERLRKTKDGAYIWGNPDMVGITSMWGLPIAQADSLAQGTAVTGDFGVYSAMVERQGIQVMTGFVGDQFKKGQMTIRATMRLAFVWYRAAAFAEIELPTLV